MNISIFCLKGESILIMVRFINTHLQIDLFTPACAYLETQKKSSQCELLLDFQMLKWNCLKGKIKICLLHRTFGRLQKLVQILIFAFWYFCLLIGKLIGILPWVSLFAIGHMEKTSLEHMFSRIMKYFSNTENMDNTFNSHLLTI